MCLVWGTTYLAIRVAIESLPPLLMAGFRWIVAGSLLIAFFRLRGERLPARDAWWSLAVRGVLLVDAGQWRRRVGRADGAERHDVGARRRRARSGWSGSTRFSVMESRSASGRLWAWPSASQESWC